MPRSPFRSRSRPEPDELRARRFPGQHDNQKDLIEADVTRLEERIVPRGEHEQTWAGQRTRDADIQRQVDELRKNLGELYSPRDAFRRMEERLDSLERQIRPRSGPA